MMIKSSDWSQQTEKGTDTTRSSRRCQGSRRDIWGPIATRANCDPSNEEPGITEGAGTCKGQWVLRRINKRGLGRSNRYASVSIWLCWYASCSCLVLVVVWCIMVGFSQFSISNFPNFSSSRITPRERHTLPYDFKAFKLIVYLHLYDIPSIVLAGCL